MAIVIYSFSFFKNSLYSQEENTKKNSVSEAKNNTKSILKQNTETEKVLKFPLFFENTAETSHKKLKKSSKFYFINITMGLFSGILLGGLGAMSVLDTTSVSPVILGSFIGGGAALGMLGGLIIALVEKSPYQYNLIGKGFLKYLWSSVLISTALGAITGWIIQQTDANAKGIGKGENDIILNSAGISSLIGIGLSVIFYAFLGKHNFSQNKQLKISMVSNFQHIGMNIRYSF